MEAQKRDSLTQCLYLCHPSYKYWHFIFVSYKTLKTLIHDSRASKIFTQIIDRAVVITAINNDHLKTTKTVVLPISNQNYTHLFYDYL